MTDEAVHSEGECPVFCRTPLFPVLTLISVVEEKNPSRSAVSRPMVSFRWLPDIESVVSSAFSLKRTTSSYQLIGLVQTALD